MPLLSSSIKVTDWGTKISAVAFQSFDSEDNRKEQVRNIENQLIVGYCVLRMITFAGIQGSKQITTGQSWYSIDENWQEQVV